MTASEVIFIIFAVAFALEEYTASREHGWASKFRFFLRPRTASELMTLPDIVYLANVRCLPLIMEAHYANRMADVERF